MYFSVDTGNFKKVYDHVSERKLEKEIKKVGEKDTGKMKTRNGKRIWDK